MLDRLVALVRFLAWKKQRMANFTDQYANGYKYLSGVFYGSLTKFGGDGTPITGVAYRHVEKSRSDVDWSASIGLGPAVQKFEVWTVTIGTSSPATNDIFTDSAGIRWNVLDVDSSELVSSNGLPVTYVLFAQRAK
jgi:hypothetical protein